MNSSLTVNLPPFGVEEGPWVLALHAFKPTWKEEDAPIEIYVVAYGRTGIVGADQRRHNRFLSYRVQLSNRGQPFLRVEEATSAPASNLPWNPHSISNAGRMFALRDVFAAYATLFPRTQPVGIVDYHNMLPDGLTPDVGEEADNAEEAQQQEGPEAVNVTEDGWVFVMPEIAISAVEPWSGAAVIGVPGLVRIINFD